MVRSAEIERLEVAVRNRSNCTSTVHGQVFVRLGNGIDRCTRRSLKNSGLPQAAQENRECICETPAIGEPRAGLASRYFP